ncbi:MAG: hypothetical protein F6K26_31200, partial [Moorea sp. SIO2I5]|nr:hypothetical protein [Moorena sp. SIO2I5]
MYNFWPEPPYFLLIFGLFVGITCGLAFEAILKQKVQEWYKTKSSQTLAEIRGIQLLVPFLGIAVGICLFLASGLAIFAV